ncbi:hypothetical protein OPQ81_005535 [Rhizoctonia solani]|nr:hypothetical protein OPQ81_005535 [Rhizoctonia solani]
MAQPWVGAPSASTVPWLGSPTDDAFAVPVSLAHQTTACSSAGSSFIDAQPWRVFWSGGKAGPSFVILLFSSIVCVKPVNSAHSHPKLTKLGPSM